MRKLRLIDTINTTSSKDFEYLEHTLTVRLPEDLAAWLAHNSSGKPFLRLAGSVEGPTNLSKRKGFVCK